MKIISRVWSDLKRRENIDVYLTVLATFTLSLIDLTGIWQDKIQFLILGIVTAAIANIIYDLWGSKLRYFLTAVQTYIAQKLGITSRYPDNLQKYLQQIDLAVGLITIPSSTVARFTIKEGKTRQLFVPLTLSAIGKEDTFLVTLQELLNPERSRIVIFGAAGSGKTSLCKYLTAELANSYQEYDILPIYIAAHDLLIRGNESLDNLIAKQIAYQNIDILPRSFISSKLKDGRCLIFFDGLDEVIDDNIHHGIQNFIKDAAYTYPQTRFVVTSRVNHELANFSNFSYYRIEELNREAITQFVDKMFLHFVGGILKNEHEKPNQLSKLRSDLLQTIFRQRDILELAKTPLFLVLIFQNYFLNASIPSRKVDLYQSCINLLLDNWSEVSETVSIDQIYSLLEIFAFDLSESHSSTIGPSNIVRVLASLKSKFPIATDLTEDSILKAVTRSGLVREVDSSSFMFSHITFQEYFVARHLIKNDFQLDSLEGILQDKKWWESIVFYCGLLDDNSELLNRIITSEFLQPLERYLLAARCVHASTKVSEKLKLEIFRGLAGQILAHYEDLSSRENAISVIQELETPIVSSILLRDVQTMSPEARVKVLMLIDALGQLNHEIELSLQNLEKDSSIAKIDEKSIVVGELAGSVRKTLAQKPPSY